MKWEFLILFLFIFQSVRRLFYQRQYHVVYYKPNSTRESATDMVPRKTHVLLIGTPCA
jgi:hypothetical protein